MLIMPIIVAVILTVLGILIVRNGKVSVNKTEEIRGTGAKLIGILLILWLPIALTLKKFIGPILLENATDEMGGFTAPMISFLIPLFLIAIVALILISKSKRFSRSGAQD